MKKKLILSVLCVITALFCTVVSASARDLKILEVIGDYPRPTQTPTPAQPSEPAPSKNVVDAIKISFLRASEGLKKNQPVICEVSFSNIPYGTYAAIQWTENGTPLEGGYYSNFGLYDGAAITYNAVLPYYGAAGEIAKVGIDINIDGVLRRETVNIPFLDGVYLDAEAQRVLGMVQPMRVSGTVLKGTDSYSSKNLTGKKGYINAGTNVYYYDHNEEVSAYIGLADGTYAWIPYSALSVSTANFTLSGDYTRSEKETFVNASDYSSSTPYLIWISTQRQKVNIFMGKQNSWVLQKSFSCCTGANKTPTPFGTYKYCAKDKAWIKPEYQVRPVLYFDIYRGLAFHSRLYSPDGSYLTDATMGKPASHGCIRMMDDDIAWMELYMTFGTTVVVY